MNFQNAWKEGKYGIDSKKFPLTEKTSSVISSFDYSKIKVKPVKDLIELHSKHPAAHEMLFGVEHMRGANPEMPNTPTSTELIYVNQLLKVYSEHAGTNLPIEEILVSEVYSEHFHGCRGEFYSAEGLKRFSMEVLPGEFEALLNSVHSAIRRVSTNPLHDSSMKKMEAVLETASKLQITDNPLHRRLLPADLPGTCHHLVNEEKLKWVK